MSRATVLIAEDDLITVAFLEQILALEGFSCHRATEAGKVVEALAAGGLAAVLLDLNMPGMSMELFLAQIASIPARPPIIIFSAATPPVLARASMELGAAAVLAKPAGIEEILNAVKGAVERGNRGGLPGTEGGVETVARLSGGVARRAPAPEMEKASCRLRVLVVEDDVISQIVTRALLESRGHEVQVAKDGKEALAALEARPCDAMVLDIELQDMNGYEVAARIRGQERASGCHLRIVALTAHAMREDRERCLEAGMDGYLSKPFQAEELFAILEHLAPRRPADVKAAVFRAPGEPFDNKQALATVPVNTALLGEMAQLFLEISPRYLREIRAAIARAEPRALAEAAHTLKGSASNFGAKAVMDAAQALETMGRAGDVTLAEEACHALEAEFAGLQAALAELAAESRVLSPHSNL